MYNILSSIESKTSRVFKTIDYTHSHYIIGGKTIFNIRIEDSYHTLITHSYRVHIGRDHAKYSSSLATYTTHNPNKIIHIYKASSTQLDHATSVEDYTYNFT